MLYYNFGFKFINSSDDQNVKINAQILEQLNTKDYPLEFFMKIITQKAGFLSSSLGLSPRGVQTVIQNNKYVYFEDKETINDLYRFIDLYITNKEKSLKEFLTIVSKNSCTMMALLYIGLYEKLNLKPYQTYEMKLDLD